MSGTVLIVNIEVWLNNEGFPLIPQLLFYTLKINITVFMAKKKSEIWSAETLPDGRQKITRMDNSVEIIDPKNPQNLPSTTDIAQKLEALKNKPSDEILKECVILFNKSDDEKTKLAILRFEAEVLKVLENPIVQPGQIVAVTVNVTGTPAPAHNRIVIDARN